MKQPSQGKIVLVPRDGLANRLRAMASVWILAQQTHRELEVYWFKDNGLNAAFTDLFEQPMLSGLRIMEASARYRLLYDFSRHRNLHVPGLLRKFRFACAFDELHQADGLRHLAGAEAKDVYITSCGIIGAPSLDSLHDAAHQLFHPVSEVRAMVDARAALFASYAVGLHIRRTDNKRSVACSPTSLFLEAVGAELTAHPDCSVFLASDSAEEKRVLCESYPHIITDSAEVTRNTTSGIRAALADMLLLSKCDVIYGSFYSSFSEFAQVLGRTRLVVLKAER